MKIIFIGNVLFSYKMLAKLIALDAEVVGIVTKKSPGFNDDFFDLSTIAKENNLPFFITDDINSDLTISWIQGKKPDIIFCFGLSTLLHTGILQVAPMGVLGFHPAELPYNRGRHPLIWALVLGLKKTASTFFFMENHADSGDIISQKIINIDYGDNAHSLYEKVIKTAEIQLEEFLPLLQNNTYKRIPQNHEKSNYWRKRNKFDGEINFRMSSDTIYNLTRALTKPYCGAHIIYKKREVKIWSVQPIIIDILNIEMGKVLNVKGSVITVKTSNGAIQLLEHEFKILPKVGDYL